MKDKPTEYPYKQTHTLYVWHAHGLTSLRARERCLSIGSSSSTGIPDAVVVVLNRDELRRRMTLALRFLRGCEEREGGKECHVLLEGKNKMSEKRERERERGGGRGGERERERERGGGGEGGGRERKKERDG